MTAVHHKSTTSIFHNPRSIVSHPHTYISAEHFLDTERQTRYNSRSLNGPAYATRPFLFGPRPQLRKWTHQNGLVSPYETYDRIGPLNRCLCFCSSTIPNRRVGQPSSSRGRRKMRAAAPNTQTTLRHRANPSMTPLFFYHMHSEF